MTAKIETHCHSLYSHDSNMSIKSIAEAGKRVGLTHIIICDHDNYDKSAEDIHLLKEYGITLINAIEFTTNEGAHIIGVHNCIGSIQAPARTYPVRRLVELLSEMGAFIIIPHPLHATGVCGNGGISDEDIDFCFKKANFIEISNYKYGDVGRSDILVKYPHLVHIAGSDAHAADMVASQYNQIEVNGAEGDILSYMIGHPDKIANVYRRKHGKVYWYMKALKKSLIYQTLLNLFPVEFRKKIKNTIINK